MLKKATYLLFAICCLAAISWAIPFQEESNVGTPERIKIALREVGNRLLLANGDSTTIIPPITRESPLIYKLSFTKELRIMPDSLVRIIDATFEKARISKNYIVEVLDCKDLEVTYSYEMNQLWDKTIIPCSGREIKEGCHTLSIQFVTERFAFSEEKVVVGMLALSFLFFVGFRFRESNTDTMERNAHNVSNDAEALDAQITEEGAISLGTFTFYPAQHSLVTHTETIQLSNKECELLKIFATRQYEVIKREELSKSVWEDNGVIVGRSLDTYISKLRKLLKSDAAIKIVNIHGVGYKLETQSSVN